MRFVLAARGGAEVGGVEPDDFVSPLAIETYVEYRMKQALKLSRAKTPKLASSLNFYERVALVRAGSATGASGVGSTAMQLP